MRGRRKLVNQLSIFEKISEVRKVQELYEHHQQNEAKGQIRHEQDDKWYHWYRIETENEDILGTIYISKTMNPLPDRIVLDRKPN